MMSTGWLMSRVYEYVGRVVVGLVWFRFKRQIQLAGALAVLAAAAGGYLLSRREPPEG